VQGWEISDPRISIKYQQPLVANGSALPPPPPGYPGEGTALIVLLIAVALLVAGFGFAVFLQRKRRSPIESPIENQVKGAIANEKAKEIATAPWAEKPDRAVQLNQPSDTVDVSSSFEGVSRPPASPEGDQVSLPAEAQAPLANEPGRIESSHSQASEQAEIQSPVSPSLESAKNQHASASSSATSPAEGGQKNGILLSSEMEAVMQTLTVRERAVMSTIIDHGGKMTQAEIRYETGTPKSSLTGILISLERRKLVIKKEWGRTNIIELSDWFLSKKEHF
jgi:uncharacterized membrane protein